MTDTLRLWSGQRQIVLDTLEKEGRYVVKWDYISQKYQDTAWSFQAAYSFLAMEAQARGLCPEGAQSAIWLYRDPRWICQDRSCHMLCLEVPVDRLLIFDLRLWNRVLNLEYLGKDQQDQAFFQQELERLGLRDTTPLFQTPFYPVQKRKVQRSWQTLLTQPVAQESYLQAAVWELRPEWLCLNEPV